jgi:hypothetical protein
VFGVAAARDRARHARLLPVPRERQLRQADAQPLGYGSHPVHQGEHAIEVPDGGESIGGAPIVDPLRVLAIEGSGQEAGAER